MKLVSADEMRSIESACVARGITLDQLMTNAGNALAAHCERLASEGSMLFLIGPGNNGGDGLIAASVLARHRREVCVYTYNRRDVSPYEGRVIRAEEDVDGSTLARLVTSSSLVVDSLLGIGQTREIDGPLRTIVRIANERRGDSTSTLATDIPTGVNADTGSVLGYAFRADGTLCMGVAKLGTVLLPGSTFTGSLSVADVGIPHELVESAPQSLTDCGEAARLLPRRKLEANKGSSGRVLAVSGSHAYTGAPVLVALAAYRAGAGLVELALPERILSAVASNAVESIFRPLADVEGKLGPDSLQAISESISRSRALVLGSGMGVSDSTIALIRGVLQHLKEAGSPPAVIDADGLNALAHIPEWYAGLSNVIITPHPGEMSRLTNMEIPDIQHDRIGVARQSAVAWGVTIVLKGARTVVAAPDGRVAVNYSGGPNLATAGTGDVLTGVVGGLLAQGCSPWDAARAGAFLHGHAGDLWRAQHGDAGMLASDLLSLLPVARTSIFESRGTHEGT